jgi:hypothetical protein
MYFQGKDALGRETWNADEVRGCLEVQRGNAAGEDWPEDSSGKWVQRSGSVQTSQVFLAILKRWEATESLSRSSPIWVTF